MNYKSFRDEVLQLINLYSARGQQLPPEGDDLKDYTLRIPSLLNAALTEIAATTNEYMTDVPLKDLTPDPAIGGRAAYLVLPEDFMNAEGLGLRLCPQGQDIGPVITLHSGSITKRLLPVSGALLRHGSNGCLHYRRQPRKLDTNPGAALDDVIPDARDEVLHTAAFYTAAMLVIREDAFLYSALRNEYDNRLSRLKHTRTAVSTAIDAVMDCRL